MPCYLRLSGDFDPDLLVAEAPVPFEIRHRRGETDRRGRVRTNSLIQACVSDGDFPDLGKQFSDMVRFVASHERELGQFCRRVGIEGSVFDFGCRYDPETPVFSRTVPREVVAAAGICHAAVELTFYDGQVFERMERESCRDEESPRDDQ